MAKKFPVLLRREFDSNDLNSRRNLLIDCALSAVKPEKFPVFSLINRE